ncbi:MAG: oligoendopeptidase F family protein, partial [Lentisphaerae bacterium]|nr:oligoendopeptidase F family protein [Lentisphaerota bacterium]
MKTFTANHNNALAADSGSANPSRTARVPPRSDLPESRKWNLSPLYQADDGWEADFLRIDPLVAPLEEMRGRLSAAPAVASFMDAETALDRLLERLWVFAHLRADEDTADQKAQARQARITAKLADVASRLSWAAPELLSNSEETLLSWMDSPELARNRYALLRLARRRKHVLTEGEERILARCGEVLSAPHQAFNLLTNADMRFPEVTGSAGEKTELSQGRYILFQRDPDRRVREDSFRKMYETFGALRNTLASLLIAAVKSHNAQAELRRFPSAIEAALHEDQVPVSLYDGLIASTHAALPVFHRYTLLRRRTLKLDRLDMYDLYAPLVPEYASEIPFERAREWVIEACAPLGAEYCAALDSAFSSRWIDVL